MENHPIPQDVTGFKFKLIGSITVKQFGYLVVAAIIAYILYLLPVNFLITLPFILIVIVLGVGAAFVPIDGRPMDVMLWYFIKAIPQDNQYVFRKTGIKLSIMQVLQAQPYAPAPKDPKNMPIRRRPPQMPQQSPPLELEAQETQFIDSIKNIFNTLPPISDTAVHPAPPSASENMFKKIVADLKVKPEKELDKKEKAKEPNDYFKEAEGEKKGQTLQHTTSTPESPPDQDVQNAKFLELAKQTAPPKPTQQKGGTKTSTRVRFLGQESSVKAGFPLLPDTPNIILGIVKDPRGKVLPNVLVEIYDKNNIPVRAFKTNQLGQFASATPLPTGTYMLHFDDPLKKNEFDTIKIDLNGIIMQPIEIFSVDEREKLRQELFGK